MSISKNLLYINIISTFIDKHNHMISKKVIILIINSLEIDLSISLILYAISRESNQTFHLFVNEKSNSNWKL